AIEDEDDLDSEEQEADFDTDRVAALPWPRLNHCVDQVVAMTESALERARAELQPASDQDEEVVDEFFPQYVDQDDLGALTEEIMEELERRLCAATRQPSWPVLHRIAETSDKEEFFRLLRPFYQNNRALFGALVTPLVQGIRVRGQLFPPSFAAGKSSTWV